MSETPTTFKTTSSEVASRVLLIHHQPATKIATPMRIWNR